MGNDSLFKMPGSDSDEELFQEIVRRIPPQPSPDSDLTEVFERQIKPFLPSLGESWSSPVPFRAAVGEHHAYAAGFGLLAEPPHQGSPFAALQRAKGGPYETYIRSLAAASYAYHGERDASDYGRIRLVDVAGSGEVSIQYKSRMPWLGFSLYYRSLWLVLLIATMAWGLVCGMTFAGAGGPSATTALAGCVGLIGLGVTLFVAGRTRRSE